MPCLKYACEFCNQEFRRDAMGVHVKAKHEDDIIKLIIQDCMDEQMSSTLQRIVNFNTTNPVYSKLYDGGRYFFGVKPMFFPDDEKDEIAIPYIKNELNMEEHQKYLNELIHKISLGDYVDVLVKLEIVAPNVHKLKKENNIMSKELREVKEQLESAERKAKYADENYQQLKMSYEMDNGETIHSMKQEIAYLKKHRNTCEREVQNYKQRLETIETQHEDEISEIRRAHGTERDKQWEIEDALRKELATIKKDNEKQLEKVQEKHKAELEKMQDKHKAELEKAVEKAIQKEKDRQKKKEEQKKKKEKAKKKAMKIAMAKNESDSDSDSSDSDSDSD
jgi:hypothetical protein